MPLTCLACRTVFPTADLQREHYHTEWHRYNLKRKVVELPPVTREEFELKRITAELENKKSGAGFRGVKTSVPTSHFNPEKQQLRCVACQKNFQSTKALNNHLQSRKHMDNAKSQDVSRQSSRDNSRRTSESFDISTQLAAEIDTTDCVQLVSKTEKVPVVAPGQETAGNIEDMDEDEWDSEEEGDWEEMDVDEDQESEDFVRRISHFSPLDCLFCMQQVSFGDVEECLSHMSRNHSFFVPYSHLLSDVGQLISYLHYKVNVLRQCILCSKGSKMFRDGGAVKKHMFDKGHNQMAHDSPEQFMEYVHFYNEPDGGEEYLDDPTGAKLEELLAAALEDDFSLVLPSGAVIGHRALNRYYKQKSRTPIDMDAQKRIEEKSRKYIGFRSGHQHHHNATNALELSRNMPSMREMKVMQRYKAREMERLQLKQNNLKTHSRDQNFWNMRY